MVYKMKIISVNGSCCLFSLNSETGEGLGGGDEHKNIIMNTEKYKKSNKLKINICCQTNM